MYAPDEWEPTEWDEVAAKEIETRRLKPAKRPHRCVVSMGEGSGRGTEMPLPGMPGKLDCQGNGVATEMREPGVPACMVVQVPAETESKIVAESRAQSSPSGFSVALPKIENTDEKEPDGVCADSGGNERDGEPNGIRNPLPTEKAFAEVHGATAGIR